MNSCKVNLIFKKKNYIRINSRLNVSNRSRRSYNLATSESRLNLDIDTVCFISSLVRIYGALMIFHRTRVRKLYEFSSLGQERERERV